MSGVSALAALSGCVASVPWADEVQGLLYRAWRASLVHRTGLARRGPTTAAAHMATRSTTLTRLQHTWSNHTLELRQRRESKMFQSV